MSDHSCFCFYFNTLLYCFLFCHKKKTKRVSDTREQTSAPLLGYLLFTQKTARIRCYWWYSRRWGKRRGRKGRWLAEELGEGCARELENFVGICSSPESVAFEYLRFFQKKDAHWLLFHFRSLEAVKTEITVNGQQMWKKILLIAFYWLHIK